MFQYMSNNCYFKTGQLLRNVDMIRKIPAVIIQGRYDLIAPFITAWKLHQAWPEAAFEVITLAGHHHTEPEVQQKILEYTDKFAKL
jgi:proline iminopeptidase